MTRIPLPAPPATQEVEACKGRVLMMCLNVINLAEVSGTFRVPLKQGMAELEIRQGTIQSVKVLPPPQDQAPATTLPAVEAKN